LEGGERKKDGEGGASPNKKIPLQHALTIAYIYNIRVAVGPSGMDVAEKYCSMKLCLLAFRAVLMAAGSLLF